MNKKVIGLIIIIVVVIGVAIGVLAYQNSDSVKLKKQLDLGNRYLIEENFERAIVEFTVAIQIDPQCPEAYLGLADAYIGMGDYESAKSALEKGIEALNNAGDTDGASQLQKKLDDIQTILDEENNVVEEAIEEVTEEVVEEEQLPEIEIKPLIDSANLDDLWGKNWLDWTKEDAISTFGLTQVSWGGYFNDDNSFCGGADRDDSFSISSLVDLDVPDYGFYSFTNEKLIFESNNTISYKYWYYPVYDAYYDDTLSKYLKDNDLTTLEGAKKILGIDDSCKINTEYGKAQIRIEKFTDESKIYIEFLDESEIDQICFYYGCDVHGDSTGEAHNEFVCIYIHEHE